MNTTMQYSFAVLLLQASIVFANTEMTCHKVGDGKCLNSNNESFDRCKGVVSSNSNQDLQDKCELLVEQAGTALGYTAHYTSSKCAIWFENGQATNDICNSLGLSQGNNDRWTATGSIIGSNGKADRECYKCDAETPSPTASPSVEPTSSPTGRPTGSPTGRPTDAPTTGPTYTPTTGPTSSPSKSAGPTAAPSVEPSGSPTIDLDNVLEFVGLGYCGDSNYRAYDFFEIDLRGAPGPISGSLTWSLQDCYHLCITSPAFDEFSFVGLDLPLTSTDEEYCFCLFDNDQNPYFVDGVDAEWYDGFVGTGPVVHASQTLIEDGDENGEDHACYRNRAFEVIER